MTRVSGGGSVAGGPIDPRIAGVEARLEEVGRILAVTGGKGGIGKSMVATTLAALLAEKGVRTGLLDLDLTAPTDHVILGFDGGFPTEEFGIDPPDVRGAAGLSGGGPLHFMTVQFFVKDRPAPLRGDDITGALLELLAITRWGALDVLVIDMPPGIGDAALDALRLIRRAESIAVATGSKVVLETVRRTLTFLCESGAPVAGVVENMARGDSGGVADLAARFSLPFLGALPFDDAVEDAVGDLARLTGTAFADALRPVRDRLLQSG